jgi:hypothetical protein
VDSGFFLTATGAASLGAGLILIQASSAAMCGGKVAVIKHFTPKEEAGDELLHPTA